MIETLPEIFAPISTEKIESPAGAFSVPKCTPVLIQWNGEPPHDSFGDKAFVAIDGIATFAELAALKIFKKGGWDGVWINSFRSKFHTSYPLAHPPTEIPEMALDILNRIHGNASFPRGAWDLFCWKNEQVIFVELKRSQKDKIRPTQIKWLERALAAGFTIENFLVVEWRF